MEAYVKSFDGTKIFYTYEKRDHPVTLVFLHGVGSNWTIWKREITFFQKIGFSTLAIDFRGHGKSDVPQTFEKYKTPFFCRDVYLVLKKEKIKRFAFLGFSLGGAIEIIYCMRYKTYLPTACIFLESAATYPFPHERMLNLNPYVTHILRFIANHKSTKKYHPSLKEVDLSEDTPKESVDALLYLLHITPLQVIVKTLDNVEKFVFKNQQKIFTTFKNLCVPTLLIEGQNDTIIPPTFARQIKKLDTKAELKILKDAGHHVTTKNTDEVNKAVFSFLQEHQLIT